MCDLGLRGQSGIDINGCFSTGGRALHLCTRLRPCANWNARGTGVQSEFRFLLDDVVTYEGFLHEVKLYVRTSTL